MVKYNAYNAVFPVLSSIVAAFGYFIKMYSKHSRWPSPAALCKGVNPFVSLQASISGGTGSADAASNRSKSLLIAAVWTSFMVA